MRTLLGLLLVLLCVSAPAQAAGKLARVDVALGDVSINKVPFLVAADNGIYTKNGLDVHQYITAEAAAAVRASGVHVPNEYVNKDVAEAPVSIGGGDPMIAGMARNPNAPLRVIVSTTETIFRSHLIAAPSVDSFTDLKGKRIGTASAGSVPHYGMIQFAKRMGWEVGRDIIVLPGTENFESLKAGKVDAITGSALISAMAPEAGYKDLGNFAQFNIPVAGSGVMFEAKWLASNRDIGLRFLKATLEATALMQKNQKVFGAAMAKWFNVRDPKVRARMYPQVREFPKKPYPLIEGIEGAVELFSPRGLKAEDFYDASLMAELDKSGFIDGLYR